MYVFNSFFCVQTSAWNDYFFVRHLPSSQSSGLFLSEWNLKVIFNQRKCAECFISEIFVWTSAAFTQVSPIVDFLNCMKTRRLRQEKFEAVFVRSNIEAECSKQNCGQRFLQEKQMSKLAQSSTRLFLRHFNIPLRLGLVIQDIVLRLRITTTKRAFKYFMA